MPTGYTAKICEGEQSFAEFCLSCARAFGALITMRDDPLDAPIPDEFKPDEYYEKRLAELRALLSRLRAMSDPEQVQYGKSEIEKERLSYLEYLAKARAQNGRLQAMAAKVQAWIPPTAEHSGLKEFMLDQLRISRDDESYWLGQLEKSETQNPLVKYCATLRETEQSINSALKSQREEKQRCAEQTAWVQALKASL